MPAQAPGSGLAAASAGLMPFEQSQEQYDSIDESMSHDDPSLARIHRGSKKNIILGLGGTAAAVAVIALFMWLAGQQSGATVSQPGTYSGQEEMSVEELDEITLYDATEGRDKALYEYHRATTRQSIRQLAEKLYGAMELEAHIKAANPRARSVTKAIPEGKEVRLPRFILYDTKEGDTLAKIAETQLYIAERAGEIAKLNELGKIKPKKKLDPGTKLKLPLFYDSTIPVEIGEPDEK